MTPTDQQAQQAFNKNMAEKLGDGAIKAAQPDLVEQLQRIADKYGQVEIRKNSDGTYDVRAGGTATYAYRLRQALRIRVEIDMVNDVTRSLEGGENMTSGAAMSQGGVAAGNSFIGSRP